MRNIRLYACLVAVLGTLWLAVPVAAAAPDGERYTLDEAVVLVQKEFGGQVLKATSSRRDGRRVYRIRILTDDGHVRTFIVDAENGLVG